ncbi:AraC family transcriptional regulator [Niameybacter massiliensis]|uniref:AraC family transcriptional regulator n=1 Tax=Holtiella tumoricola TaxID=3018743 RepID=A0AA42DML9_9FIRM|nr:AraC family transcriptional regulator [Holtiella tumoricola]MDA3731769.1 AraC family transcriptional regulator [Holtiella tumoricola]
MTYISTKLRSSVQVSHIITIHYFEYMKDFYFAGEVHNFWEFLCVDKGEVEVQADDKMHHLKQGDIIFHKPMEFHAIKSIGHSAPNLIAISFKSSSPIMDCLQNKHLTLGSNDKKLISKIISEASQAFSTPLNVPAVEQITRAKEVDFGAEQLIKIHLEELLIGFIRRILTTPSDYSPVSPMVTKEHTFEHICHYLEKHICDRLSVPIICNDNLISKSCLQELFHSKVNIGVMEYFNRHKIDLAKQLIRENEKNLSQIADYLSYSSLAHFSKQFKRFTGMSPTEYGSSIKLLSENVNQGDKDILR